MEILTLEEYKKRKDQNKSEGISSISLAEYRKKNKKTSINNTKFNGIENSNINSPNNDNQIGTNNISFPVKKTVSNNINLPIVKDLNNTKMAQENNLPILPVNNQTQKSSRTVTDVAKEFLDTTGKSAKTILTGINYLGQAAMRGAEELADTAIDVATSNVNPYYWFNQDKLENHQNIAQELIKKDATGDLITKLSGDEDFNKNFLDKDSLIKEDNLAGKVITSVGQMLPSIATGNPTAATTILGLQSYGGGVEEAYNNGANTTQARLYGLGNAAIELGTEKLFGGIPGTKTSGWLDNLVARGLGEKTFEEVSKSISKEIIKAGYKMVGEAGEEALAEIINPILKNATYSEGEKINWNNVLESAVIGGITSGILEAPSNIRNVNTAINNKNKVNLSTVDSTTSQNVNLPPVNNKETNLSSMKNENINLPTVKYRPETSDNSKINNLRQSAVNYFDNSQKTHNLVSTIEKVIADKDYNVVFDNTITNKKGESVNAQITNNNGQIEIKINPNSPRTGEFLLCHEITHAIETDSMKQLVMDYASNHSDFNKALESLKQTYGTNDVSDEVLADISGQLFGSQEFINSLSVKQPNVFKRIYNKIIELANKITGNSKEGLFIKDLKNKWETAYRNTSTEQAISNLNNETKYAQKTLKDGTNYIETEKNLFTKEDGTTMSQREIYNSLVGKQITFNDGITATIKQWLPNNKNMYNELFKRYPNYKNVNNIKSVNKNINENIVELLENSDNVSPNEPDYMNRHKDNKIDSFDTRKVSFFDGKNAYDLDFSIAKMQDGNYVAYAKRNLSANDTLLNKIKKEAPTSKSRGVLPYVNNISQDNNNVKSDISSTKYSMQENINNTQELDNSSFSLDANAKRYEDLFKTNKIEYFRKDNGDIRIYLIDSNNNLVNQFDLWSNTNAIKELGEKLGNHIYETANNDNQIVNIGNDINNLGTDTDYFMNHRPTESGITADNLINQNVESPMPKDMYEHPEYYFMMNEEYSKESMDALKKIKGNPNAEITIYRATPGNSINSGDWITLSKKYAEFHNQSQFDGKGNIIKKVVRAKDIQYAGDDINEWGYFPTTNDDIRYSKQDNKWQEYVEDNYKTTGTRTKFEDIKIPIVKENKINLPPVQTTNEVVENDKKIMNPNETSRTNQTESQNNNENKIAQLLDKRPSTAKPTLQDSAYKTIRELVDKGEAINRLAKKTGNKELYAKYDHMGTAEAEGNYAIAIAQTDNKGHKIGKSVVEIWKPVEDAELVEEFSNYLLHKHNIARWQQGKPVFGEEVTSDISKKFVEESEKKYPQFAEWSKDINTYNKNQMQNMVDAGLTSKESQEYLNNTYDNYVRIYRDVRGNSPITQFRGNLKINVPIKKAKGGNQDILPLKDSMAQQTIETKKAIRRNEFGLELLNVLNNGKNVEYDGKQQVVKNDDGTYSFTVFKDGQPIKMEIDEGIYEALEPKKTYNFEKTLPFRAIQKVSQIQRGLLTDKNPLFIATNFFKDIGDAPFNSKYASKFAKNYVVAANEIKNNGELWNKYRALGGEQNTYFDYESGVKLPSNSKASKFVRKIQSINQIVEQLPRFTEFISTLEAGGTEAQAMYNAAEVTTNFKRGGDTAKALNRNGANFLNASIQGFDKQIRNFTGQNGVKGYVNLLAKATILGVIPSVLNHLLLDDDEDYQELPDYIKDSYFLFKTGNGEFIRIPKGRVVSTFGMVARRTLEYADGEKDAYDGMFTQIANQVAPNNPLEDNVYAPIKSVMTNKSWNGSEIVPTRLQDELPENQYDEKTDAISKFIGKIFKVSPKKVNYLLDQYTGAIGDIVLPYITPQARQNPVSAKFTTDSVLNNKNVSDFYDIKDELTAKSNSTTATNEDKLKTKYLNSIGSEMNELYKEKREIQNSSLNNDEKYKEVRNIQEQINKLSKEALLNYEDVSSYSNYGRVADKEYYLNSKDEWTKVDEKESDELANLEMSDKNKNEYFSSKVKIGIIRNDNSKNSETKHTEINNILIKSKLNDKEKAYLYNKYYSSDKTINNILNSDISFNEFLKFDMQTFETKYDSNGKAITNSRKSSVINYVNSLNLTVPQKAILIKMEYASYDKYDKQVVEYINNKKLSIIDKGTILKSIGIDSFDKQLINYVNSQKLTVREKTKMLEDMGFTVRNGKVIA